MKIIIRPRPIKDFKRKRTVFIPFEPVKGMVKNLFQGKIIKSTISNQSKLYLLKDKIILCQAVGAPLAILWLEALIASGTREIITLGFCGSFSKEFPIGSAAIITKAYSQEGTSKHYFPKRKTFSASKKLTAEIKNKLERKHLPYSQGVIVSMDAPFRETSDWLKKMVKRGISYVDMELSAVYALAQYYQLEAASLMIISDIVTKDKWISGFSQIEEAVKKYFPLFI